MSAVSMKDGELTKRTVRWRKGRIETMGKRGEKREGGEVHLNVILIRRPLPLLINEILVIGKVVVAISRPLG